MFHVEQIVTMTVTGNIVKTDKNKKTRKKYGLAGYGGFGSFVFHSRLLRMSGARYLHSMLGSVVTSRGMECADNLWKSSSLRKGRGRHVSGGERNQPFRQRHT
jgi:hypothetical protein